MQALIAGGVLVVAVIVVLTWLRPTAHPPPAAPATISPPEKSIAVLPFIDLSEKKDQEYLADGMSEEIIDRLARVPELRVPARTSSFYFKGKSTSIADIAKTLGVAHILEGSVRRSGDRLRVSTQLVRAETGYHIWSESYDRELQDVFKVQDEIATAVATALQITLTGGPLTRELGGTRNLDAYQLYLRSRDAIDENSEASLKEAQAQLEQALTLDPDFGLAWSFLAQVTLAMTDHSLLQSSEGFERARQLATHALKVSPDLANAHAALAYVHRSYDWDWTAAATEVHRALRADPSDRGALLYDGLLATTLGHWEEADRKLRAVMARDPLYSYGNFNIGNALYLSGRYADAEAVFRKVLVTWPDFLWTRPYLAKTLLVEGKPRAALEILQPGDNNCDKLDDLSLVLLANNHKAQADLALQQLVSQCAGTDAYYIAMTYAYRNEKEIALQWLDRAYKQKDAGLIEIKGEPLLTNIVREPRFRALLQKMNLSE